ncbi:MAG: hypothetical protein O3B45_03990 [Bacteroidetes bacterium]|nr:hypothetical protein [Bacteroidota bacterium]
MLPSIATLSFMNIATLYAHDDLGRHYPINPSLSHPEHNAPDHQGQWTP